MITLEKYLIFAVLLPVFLVTLGRWVFAFYVPVNFATHIAGYLNHQPLLASKKAIRLFNYVNASLFLLSFLCLCLIATFPFVDRFYHVGLTMYDMVILFKFLIPLYAIWFLTLFTTGYLYDSDFFNDLFYNNPETKFYSVSLEDTYKAITGIPRHLWTDLTLIFDNETKKTDRMNLHKSLIKEYKKQKNDKAVEYLQKAVEINQKDIEKYIKARHRGGHLAIFWLNLAESAKILYLPIIPAILFYTMLVESFVSIFPSLSKIYEKNEAGEQAVEVEVEKREPTI